MVTSALNVPSAPTVAVIVCVLPALSVTVKVTVLPSGKLVVPEIAGVLSFVSPCPSSTNVGALVLMLPVALSVTPLPASSSAVAVTVKFPSASSCGTSTEKLPLASTKVLMVCVLPALSTTVSETTLPSGRSVLPDKVGVGSLPEPTGFKDSDGAVVSTMPPFSVTLAVLPFSSTAVAVTE